MLTALGLCVSVVSNGQGAVDRVRACAFDLVLMDCQMPVMDGYEATAAIRALPAGRGRNVPIVAVTANALHGEGQKCLNAGMDAYLAKPFTMSQLHEVLTRWLHPGRSVHARSTAR
jgi:two-component system sensor histidine kinase/response regulator